jgi:hypothetical protein
MPIAPHRTIPLATVLLLTTLSLTVLVGNARGADPAPPASHCLEPGTEQAEKAAILKVISNMETAWNHGDFRGYMQGFKNPDVVFVSGGRMQSGWQGTLDHYVRDYGASP